MQVKEYLNNKKLNTVTVIGYGWRIEVIISIYHCDKSLRRYLTEIAEKVVTKSVEFINNKVNLYVY